MKTKLIKNLSNLNKNKYYKNKLLLFYDFLLL